MTKLTVAKHQWVGDKLKAAIVAGEYRAGDQLPAEQFIAQQYNVSLMTARRAVSDLVSADLLERRARKGTFVRSRTREKLANETLNLIAYAYESAYISDFLRNGSLAAKHEGWNVNIVHLPDDQQDAAVRILESGAMAIVMLDDIRPGSTLNHAMRSAKERVVSLHPDLSAFGVPSVLTDLGSNVRMAWDRLRRSGHENIGIIAQFPAETQDEENSIIWQRDFCQMVKNANMDLEVIRVAAPRFTSPTEKAYDVLRAFLESDNKITALISMGDEMTVGALAACRHSGRPCPERISVINIGNSPLMKFAMPEVTCVDLNFKGQVEIAVEILKANAFGSYGGDMLRYCRSSLIERSSVAAR